MTGEHTPPDSTESTRRSLTVRKTANAGFLRAIDDLIEARAHTELHADAAAANKSTSDAPSPEHEALLANINRDMLDTIASAVANRKVQLQLAEQLTANIVELDQS